MTAKWCVDFQSPLVGEKASFSLSRRFDGCCSRCCPLPKQTLSATDDTNCKRGWGEERPRRLLIGDRLGEIKRHSLDMYLAEAGGQAPRSERCRVVRCATSAAALNSLPNSPTHPRPHHLKTDNPDRGTSFRPMVQAQKTIPASTTWDRKCYLLAWEPRAWVSGGTT